MGDPQRNAVEQVVAAERDDERRDLQPGDEGTVAESDKRTDGDCGRERDVDRQADDDPQDGKHIGAETVHGAEREVDLAYDDHQGKPE